MAQMRNYLTKLLSIIPSRPMSAEQKFLSESTDLADLERRVKEIQRPKSIPSYRYWI